MKVMKPKILEEEIFKLGESIYDLTQDLGDNYELIIQNSDGSFHVNLIFEDGHGDCIGFNQKDYELRNLREDMPPLELYDCIFKLNKIYRATREKVQNEKN